MITEKPTYKLETFEGPLDLLLSLIEKHKLDIYDIEISLLTQQYMEYIEAAQQQNTELTANFLEMASHLLYIKSCSLLPSDEPEEDPKEALEAMLIEYAKYKKLAGKMKEGYIGHLIFARQSEPEGLPVLSPEYSSSADRLIEAYSRIIERNDRKKPVPVSAFRKLVGTKFVSVPSKVIFVLKRLMKRGSAKLRTLFNADDGRSGIVATFLAVLELLRHGRVDIKQDSPTGEDVEIVFLGKES